MVTKGFTLIEIMVVVLIMGLLAGLIGVNVVRYLDESRVKAAAAQIKSLEEALELYRMETGAYPTTNEGLSVLVGKFLKAEKLPKDPWGLDYYYISDGKTFTLKSLGKDKIAGTEDDIDAAAQ